MECGCSLPWHPWQPGRSSPTPGTATSRTEPECAQKMRTDTPSHHPLLSGLSHGLVCSRRKLLMPSSCLPSPFSSRDPRGHQECEPGSLETQQPLAHSSSQAQKLLFHPGRPCWMAKHSTLQSQMNFSALAAKLIFKKMARTTALGHTDHFLRS